MGRRTFIPLVVLGILAALLYPWWLPFLGTYLLHAQPPGPADAAVVLAGDISGRRVLRAAELARDGFVPLVFVSGPVLFYGQNEADLAIAMAVRQGYPASTLQPVRLTADSTREEGAAFLRYLREHNVRRFLVVTSDFHTRRTERVFRTLQPALFPEAQFRVVSAPGDQALSEWWKTRPSRKIIYMEWQKLIADWLGI